MVGLIQLLDYFYYTALTVAALYESASDDEQAGWRDLLTMHLEQLREWADNYLPTFGDKHALVSAEIARVEGRGLETDVIGNGFTLFRRDSTGSSRGIQQCRARSHFPV